MYNFDNIWCECEKFGILQQKSEFKNLLDLIYSRECKTLLEIGTYGAGTSRGFTEVVDLVISMDPQYNSNIQTLQKIKKNFLFVHGFSTDITIQDYVTKLCPQVDCLFIDADHSEASIRHDFNTFKRFVKPGGIIAFHDTVETKTESGAKVSILWNELKLEYKKYWEFHDEENVKLNSNCGIGVIEIPK